MILVRYPGPGNSRELGEKILLLEQIAWPSKGEEEPFPSAPNTYVTSFILLEGERAICHVGVRKSTLSHCGQAYTAYGLSEVVTHPGYRKKGIASRLVKEALAFIHSKQADLCIFTCNPRVAPFYAQLGFEQLIGCCFVGGTKERPLRSDQLSLLTLAAFLSPRAEAHRGDFQHADLLFYLGENQLW